MKLAYANARFRADAHDGANAHVRQFVQNAAALGHEIWMWPGVTHPLAKALPGNPYDGHTLAEIVPDMEAMIGNGIDRILADAGYRGHNAPLSHKFKVYTSGQKRRMTPAIKREMKRRAAIEPVIGHIKTEHRMGRNYLAHQQGDAINAVLAAAGYNFRLLLTWLRIVLRPLLAMLFGSLRPLHA